MKFIAASILVLASSAAAFAPQSTTTRAASTSLNAFSKETLPGALPPVGFFDPLGFADKADEKTLKRYREAEITHGRVAMLAVVGFLVGERVAGSTVLFDGKVNGAAIDHIPQISPVFWLLLIMGIGGAEKYRAEKGWVEPSQNPVGQPGLLRADYTPGDLGFDPLGLKPTDPEEFEIIQTKELQNGRLAMIAAAGFLAQEAVDHIGILEHLQIS